MIQISYLKDGGTPGYLTLGILSDGEKLRLTVDEETYAAVGAPLRGDTLSADSLAILREASERYGVVLSALHILGYGDNSERTLIRKLRDKGFSRAAAEFAAEEMVRLGYLDEERQARRLVLSGAAKLYGQRRVLAACVAKGYKADTVRRAMAKCVREGEIDWQKNLSLLYEKKSAGGSLTPDEKNALKYKYGY